MRDTHRAHTRGRRLWLFCTAGLLACVLAIAGCGGGDATLAGSGAGRVAEFVPSRSQVYLEISTDLESGQWRQAADLASRFPIYQDLLRRAKESLSRGKIDFDRDLRPLLGDSAAVAIPDVTRTDDPTVLIVVDIADGKETEVRDLFVRDGSLSNVEREHRGVSIYRSSDIYMAIFDESLVASQSADMVARSIDTRRGGRDASLAGSAKIRQALAGLPDEVLVQGYVDFAEIISGIGAAQRPEVRRQIEASGLSADAGLAMSLSAESDGIRLKAVASKVEGAPQVGVYTPALPAHIPADAVAYLGANDLYNVTRVVLERVSEGNQQTKDQLGQVRGALNFFGLPIEDLKNITSGEVAAAVLPVPSGGRMPDVVAVLTATDGKAAATTLENVRKQLDLLSRTGTANIPSFSQVRLGNGVTGWETRLDGGVSIVHGIDGRNVLLGTSVDAIKSVQSPKARLSEDRGYRDATDQMPSEVQSVMWLNVEQTLKMVQTLAPDEMTDEVMENLRPVRNVAGWSTAGDRPTFEFFITIG